MRAANRIIMKWRHGGEISRRDRRLARPEREISRQLSPKSGFQGQVLSRHQHSRIGKTTSRQRDGIIQWLEPRAAGVHVLIRDLGDHLQREMMLAHHKFLAWERVPRGL